MYKAIFLFDHFRIDHIFFNMLQRRAELVRQFVQARHIRVHNPLKESTERNRIDEFVTGTKPEEAKVDEKLHPTQDILRVDISPTKEEEVERMRNK